MNLQGTKGLPPELRRSLEDLEPRWSELDLPAGAVGVILGSGLGDAVGAFERLWEVDFGDLGLPRASVAGHRGSLLLAASAGPPLLFLRGRLHRYEGLPDSSILLPAAAMACLDLRALLVTNAAGSLDPSFRAGDFMLIRDILSLQLNDPLRGASADPAPRHPAPRPLYDKELGEALLAAAREVGVRAHEGVLTVATGPAYETAAEIRMTRALGAQAASMSTFPESMLLARMGLPRLAMSCITNVIEEGTALGHEEVIETGHRAAADFGRMLGAWCGRLGP